MIDPAAGTLLVSDPFLRDPNFMRTVVFLCEHSNQGSFGFVLNRPYEQMLDEFVPELEGFSIPVFYGGPVQPDTLHFLHNIPKRIPGSQHVISGVYWGGDFNRVIELIRNRNLDKDNIKFFLGYSGWSDGQLEEEISAKSWLTTMGNSGLIFQTQAGEIWRQAIHEMDDKYHPIVHYPIDPQLN